MIPPRDIAANVPMRAGLEHVGSRLRGRCRADCPLCSGHSRGTVAYTERIAKCHRCGWGGDIFTLLMAVYRCDFKSALRKAADLAGIRLDDSCSSRRGLEKQRREQERLGRGADRLINTERNLKRDYRECWRELDALARRIALANQDGRHDPLLVALPGMTRRAAAGYQLLAFGDTRARARFAAVPEARERAIDAVLDGRVRGVEVRV